MGLDAIAKTISAGGSSPFFFTCAIQSMVFGELGRKNQEELMSTNLEFKERMTAIREEYSRERLDEQLLFKRESYELGKQYQIQQTAMMIDSRLKQIEFHNFCQHYWPLNYDIFAVMKEQSRILSSSHVVPIKVIIAKTEVTTFDKKHRESSYGEFCELVADNLNGLYGIDIQSRPWKTSCNSNICESMNLNYIMQGIPTLLIFPYQLGDSYGVEIATWSFNKGVRSLKHSKILTIDNFDSQTSIDKVVASVSSIVGMTRDAYMLAEYHMPIAFPKMLNDNILSCPEIMKMLQQHYKELAQCVDSPVYTSLCTSNELSVISASFESANNLIKY